VATLLTKVKRFIREHDYVRLSKRTLLLVMLVAGFGFSAAAALTWEVTNSSDFCGNVCHLMTPQAVTFKQSAHAEVDCTNCHLGIGVSPQLVARKATELTQVYKNLAGAYETPLQIKHLRPARYTCEKCHWTEAFYDDKVKVIRRFNEDKANSLVKTALVIKTGGGTSREGKGYGIHWHVENKVEYIATDSLKQNIPWVQVTNEDGVKVTYIEKEKELDTEQIETMEKRVMDCIDCHNRASHYIPNPDRALNEAIAAGSISRDIPWVKKNFLALLQQRDLRDAKFEQEIKILNEMYQEQYSGLGDTILEDAFDELRQIYRQTVYSDMEINWRTYPDGLGHKDFPGCFRCHDGQHVTESTTVDPARKVIRKECNLCHSVPLKLEAGEIDAQPVLEEVLNTASEPETHFDAQWADNHGSYKNDSCYSCHEREGYNVEEFCSNGSCHGYRWDLPKVTRFYAGKGINCIQCHQIAETGAHGVREHQIDCISCHDQVSWQADTKACESCHNTDNHEEKSRCWDCHNFREEDEAKS